MLRTLCFAFGIAAVSAAQSPFIPALSVQTVPTFAPGGAALAPAVPAPGPFFRSELLQFDVTGAAPFTPVSLFLDFCGASCGPPSPAPVLAGCTFTGLPAVNFNTVLPITAWDGLGCFGSPALSMRADGSGNVSLLLLIPTMLPLGGLGASLRAQVAALIPPSPGATGVVIALGGSASFSLSDPPPVIAPTAVTPSFFPEGVPTEITLFGSALLRATVPPVVRFTAANGGALGVASNVRVVLEAGVPVIKATTPAFLGAPTNPPATSAGRVDVTVDYAAPGLFDAAPPLGLATTTAAVEADPTYFVMQAFVPSPSLASVSPGAGPLTGLSGVLLDGTSFLRGSTVTFDAGNPGEIVLSPVCDSVPLQSCEILNGGRLRVDAPAHAGGRVAVRVRGPDHLTISPRETTASLAATFAYFDPAQLAIQVNGVTPSSVQESLGTVSVSVTGTCADAGGLAALDPGNGPIGVRLGYLVDGATGSIDVSPAVMALATPDPATPGVAGSFRIDLDLPGLPPGLNPVGLSGAAGPGLTNSGLKVFQIFPAAQFGSNPHQALAAIPGAESGNRLVYRAAAPIVTSIAPNNVGRADGGQRVRVTGDNFFTQQTAVALAQSASTTRILFGGFGPSPAVATFVALIDQQTIEIDTPDVLLLLGGLPATTDAVAENVEGSTSVTTPDYTQVDGDATNDFVFTSSLGDPLALTPFSTAGLSLTLDTGTLAAPNTFFFGGSLVVPAGFTLKAEGEAPLVIRCRGDFILDGDLDLRGAAIVTGVYGRPSGGSRGGAGADPFQFALENPTTGRAGSPPASTLPPALVFGGGGFHAAFGGGGGGGGMSAAGAAGQGGIDAGAGGLSYGLSPALPLPLSFLDLLRPFGGAGGGAGGLGVDGANGGGLFLPGSEPSGGAAYEIALNGAGGNGGGAVLIASDGRIVINGRILSDGADGGVLAPA